MNKNTTLDFQRTNMLQGTLSLDPWRNNKPSRIMCFGDKHSGKKDAIKRLMIDQLKQEIRTVVIERLEHGEMPVVHDDKEFGFQQCSGLTNERLSTDKHFCTDMLLFIHALLCELKSIKSHSPIDNLYKKSTLFKSIVSSKHIDFYDLITKLDPWLQINVSSIMNNLLDQHGSYYYGCYGDIISLKVKTVFNALSLFWAIQRIKKHWLTEKNVSKQILIINDVSWLVEHNSFSLMLLKRFFDLADQYGCSILLSLEGMHQFYAFRALYAQCDQHVVFEESE